MDVKVFKNMHEALVNKLKNANKKVQKQTDNLRLYTIIPSQWQFNEILEALLTLTPQDVQVLNLSHSFVQSILLGSFSFDLERESS